MFPRIAPYSVAPLLLLGFCFSPSKASADTLLVTASGSYSDSTPPSSVSVVSFPFSLSFSVESQPVVLASGTNGFSIPFSGFKYLLGPFQIVSPLVGSINFFDDVQGGLFSVCFASPCSGRTSTGDSLVFRGAQAFSGSLAQPTILTGDYAATASYISIASNVDPSKNGNYAFGTLSAVSITNVSASTPEPTSLVLFCTGLVAISGSAWRNRIKRT